MMTKTIDLRMNSRTYHGFASLSPAAQLSLLSPALNSAAQTDETISTTTKVISELINDGITELSPICSSPSVSTKTEIIRTTIKPMAIGNRMIRYKCDMILSIIDILCIFFNFFYLF